MANRERRQGVFQADSVWEADSEARSRRPAPSKLTRSGDPEIPTSPWCGKLTRAQTEDQVSPADALRYASWLLQPERGWAAVSRRASDELQAPDEGALASAFGVLEESHVSQPLPLEVAHSLGASLGVDARRIRIHTDERAAAAAELLHARAFTIGEDIYFAAGAYEPQSESGLELLAHEVAHVAQYQQGRSPAAGRISQASDQHELEADELARRFLVERRRREAKLALEVRSAVGSRDEASSSWWLASAPSSSSPPPASPPAVLVQRKAAPASAGKGAPSGAPPLPEVVDLLATGSFEPSAAIAAHIDKAGKSGAQVRVKLGALGAGIIRVKRAGKNYVTIEDKPQIVPLASALFAPLPGLSPVVRVRIGARSAGSITGYAAPEASAGNERALQKALGENPEAFGLRGFELPHLQLTNKLENGTLTLASQKAAKFSLGGWVDGTLSFGVINSNVTLDANAHIHARGIKDADLTISRDAQGHLHGSVELVLDLGDKFSGSARATYDNGDVAVKGELGYRSEKFNGKLGLIVADAAQAEQMVRAQIDPLGVMPLNKVGGDPSKQPKTKKGERAIAGWGELDFAFTDWLTGKAMVVYGPTGHLTVVGKIAPPKRLDLMKEPKGFKRPIMPEVNIEASYGLPYIADIHVGIGVSLSAEAELGPIYMSDLAIEGIYSTDPTVMNAFSITGALRAQAHAGLELDVKGYAGLRILKHSVNVGAGIKGNAGIRAYAEARPTLGYREIANPTAGKQGEYYLKGHLEMAAQPVLSLGGRLFVELDSPWWSPAPDKTWEWPIGNLEYPMPTQLGVGADIDYVVGSDKWPELKLTQPSFDASKFVDSMMDDRLPKKTGAAGDQSKKGDWKGVTPTAPTAAPPTVAKSPAKDTKPTAGTPSKKAGKGKQLPDEQKNVPQTKDGGERWNAGMEALGKLRKRSEKDPETSAEIKQHLADLKSRFGFTELKADRSGDQWLVDAAMNPAKKDIPIQADPKETRTAKTGTAESVTGAAVSEGGKLTLTKLVEPCPVSLRAEGALAEDLEKATSGQVLFRREIEPAEAVRRILREHPDARFDRSNGTLTLSPVAAPRPDTPLPKLANQLAQQTGVSRVSVAKDECAVTLRGELNPWTPLATVQRGVGTSERLQLAEAVEEFHQEFASEQWARHFDISVRQAQLDLKAAQTMTPPRLSKTKQGKYRLRDAGWHVLKADIMTRFQLTARRVIKEACFGIAELKLFCEQDERLPKQRDEYENNDKMTQVLAILEKQLAIRRTSKGKWEFQPMPARRYLPAGWSGQEVRARYFENGSGFINTRDLLCQAACTEVVSVIELYERAEALKAGNAAEHRKLRRAADFQWSRLRRAEKVAREDAWYPGTASAKARYSSTSSYHADHIEPLAWLWEYQGFNNVDHSQRLEKCGSPTNLRSMWGPDNASKGAVGPDGRTGEYMRMPWVGPLFTGPATSGDIMDAGYGSWFRLAI